MSNDRITFPAEWEISGPVLMALPHSATDWNYMLNEVLQCYASIIRTLNRERVRIILLCHNVAEADLLLCDLSWPELLVKIEMDFNDTWTRDYGPLQVIRFGRRRILNFGFNGWGLKFAADKDNLVNLHLRELGVIPDDEYRNESDFVLEGGSIESDGRGTILTTTRCLTSPNRNGGKTKQEINEILRQRLGAEHVLWLDYGALTGDDTDSHIDTLARMAPGNTILFTGCRNVDDEHFEELLKMRAQLTLFRTPEGDPYNLVELPLPDPIYDADGERLPATYANYLIAKGKIFMPTYAQPANDMLAQQTIKVAFPDYKVIPVDCRALIRQHGSLHCATMGAAIGAIYRIERLK